jgi:hypothetical protein
MHSITPGTSRLSTSPGYVEVAGSWTVRFAESLGARESIQLDERVSWT